MKLPSTERRKRAAERRLIWLRDPSASVQRPQNTALLDDELASHTLA